MLSTGGWEQRNASPCTTNANEFVPWSIVEWPILDCSFNTLHPAFCVPNTLLLHGYSLIGSFFTRQRCVAISYPHCVDSGVMWNYLASNRLCCVVRKWLTSVWRDPKWIIGGLFVIHVVSGALHIKRSLRGSEMGKKCTSIQTVQRSAKVFVRGLVKFVPSS